MENDRQEYKDYFRRVRFSNLLGFCENANVDVYVYGGMTFEGRITQFHVDEEASALVVACEGFTAMLDVGNIVSVAYEPDTDHVTLQMKERTTAKFKPVITPTEVAEYVAEILLDEAEQAAEDEHEDMPEWLANIYAEDDDIDGDDLGAVLHETGEEGGEDTE